MMATRTEIETLTIVNAASRPIRTFFEEMIRLLEEKDREIAGLKRELVLLRATPSLPLPPPIDPSSGQSCQQLRQVMAENLAETRRLLTERSEDARTIRDTRQVAAQTFDLVTGLSKRVSDQQKQTQMQVTSVGTDVTGLQKQLTKHDLDVQIQLAEMTSLTLPDVPPPPPLERKTTEPQLGRSGGSITLTQQELESLVFSLGVVWQTLAQFPTTDGALDSFSGLVPALSQSKIPAIDEKDVLSVNTIQHTRLGRAIGPLLSILLQLYRPDQPSSVWLSQVLKPVVEMIVKLSPTPPRQPPVGTLSIAQLAAIRNWDWNRYIFDTREVLPGVVISGEILGGDGHSFTTLSRPVSHLVRSRSDHRITRPLSSKVLHSINRKK